MALSWRELEEIASALRGKATNFKYSDVARWLQRAGFQLHGLPKGSHRVWIHPTGERVQLIEKGRGEMLPVYVKNAARAILKLRGRSDEGPEGDA